METTPLARTDVSLGYRRGWSSSRLSAAVAASRGDHARPAGDRPHPDEIEFFATVGRRQDIPHGVTLTRRGISTGEVHLVERGALALIGEHDGRRPIVAFALRKEFCGSVPALLREASPWDVVTVMDSSVLTVPAARFAAAVHDRWVDRWTTRTLAWLAEVGASVADIDGRDLHAQVATLLLRNPGEFSVDFCHRTISDLLDIDRMTAKGIVNDLEQRGAIRVTGGHISIARPDTLREVIAVRRPSRRIGPRTVGHRRRPAASEG